MTRRDGMILTQLTRNRATDLKLSEGLFLAQQLDPISKVEIVSIRRKLLNLVTSLRFPGSSRYWELRYGLGEDSGDGSYGEEANYKRTFINGLLTRRSVASVIDFGCGDGNQLEGLQVDRYRGLDVSPTAVGRCAARYAHRQDWSFATLDTYGGESAEAALSLDVLYHLVEEQIFATYLDRLFGAATRLVVIYASNSDSSGAAFGRHVRHRAFIRWVADHAPEFRLIESPDRPDHLPRRGPHAASFWVYERLLPAES